MRRANFVIFVITKRDCRKYVLKLSTAQSSIPVAFIALVECFHT
jgi:hypothetical protein